METGKASIMAFIEPMVSLLLGVMVFGEVVTLQNMIGVAGIVVAVALLNLPENALHKIISKKSAKVRKFAGVKH